jgi:hypothetical protein
MNNPEVTMPRQRSGGSVVGIGHGCGYGYGYG